MKNLLIVFLLALGGLSCKKCLHCELTVDGNVQTYEDACGGQDDMDALEEECINDAIAAVNAGKQGHCHCTDQQ